MSNSPTPSRLKRELATTIVALAAIGETNTAKLKHFALHAARAAFRPSTRPQSEQMATNAFEVSATLLLRRSASPARWLQR